MKYFKLKEFDCMCCGANQMAEVFLLMLDLARSFSGIPYIILSGYRCEKHNTAVGSTSRNHIMGRAADIIARDTLVRGQILKGLYRAGFKRVGISFLHGSIHVDSMALPEGCWCELDEKIY